MGCQVKSSRVSLFTNGQSPRSQVVLIALVSALGVGVLLLLVTGDASRALLGIAVVWPLTIVVFYVSIRLRR